MSKPYTSVFSMLSFVCTDVRQSVCCSRMLGSAGHLCVVPLLPPRVPTLLLHYFHHVFLLSCSITSTMCAYCPAPLLPPSVPTVLLITSTMCAYCSEETWENLGNLTGRTLMHFFLGTGTAFCFYDHFLSGVHCVVVAQSLVN